MALATPSATTVHLGKTDELGKELRPAAVYTYIHTNNPFSTEVQYPSNPSTTYSMMNHPYFERSRGGYHSLGWGLEAQWRRAQFGHWREVSKMPGGLMSLAIN